MLIAALLGLTVVLVVARISRRDGRAG